MFTTLLLLSLFYSILGFDINNSQMISFPETKNGTEILKMLNYKYSVYNYKNKENYVVLGGLNKFIFIYPTENETLEIKIYKMWKSSRNDYDLCYLKSKINCENYVRVLIRMYKNGEKTNKYLVCGTNAYNPICFYYNTQTKKLNHSHIVNGNGICPPNPEDDDYLNLYSPKVENLFSAISHTGYGHHHSFIYKGLTHIAGLKTGTHFFPRKSKFIYAFEYCNKIYFLLNEYIDISNTVLSGVIARVSKYETIPKKGFKLFKKYAKNKLNCKINKFGNDEKRDKYIKIIKCAKFSRVQNILYIVFNNERSDFSAVCSISFEKQKNDNCNDTFHFTKYNYYDLRFLLSIRQVKIVTIEQMEDYLFLGFDDGKITRYKLNFSENSIIKDTTLDINKRVFNMQIIVNNNISLLSVLIENNTLIFFKDIFSSSQDNDFQSSTINNNISYITTTSSSSSFPYPLTIYSPHISSFSPFPFYNVIINTTLSSNITDILPFSRVAHFTKSNLDIVDNATSITTINSVNIRDKDDDDNYNIIDINNMSIKSFMIINNANNINEKISNYIFINSIFIIIISIIFAYV